MIKFRRGLSNRRRSWSSCPEAASARVRWHRESHRTPERPAHRDSRQRLQPARGLFVQPRHFTGPASVHLPVGPGRYMADRAGGTDHKRCRRPCWRQPISNGSNGTNSRCGYLTMASCRGTPAAISKTLPIFLPEKPTPLAARWRELDHHAPAAGQCPPPPSPLMIFRRISASTTRRAAWSGVS